jgi:putative transposase
VIDCGDRFVFDIAVTKSQESAAILAPLARSLRDCFRVPGAVPDGLELRTDHGPQYTGADCEKLCRHWHLEQTIAPAGQPTGNAVAERFSQTLNVESIWTRDWDNIDELRAAVRVWLHSYNYEHPHQALKEQTPAEKREKNLGRERFAEIFPSIAQGSSAPPPSTETGDKTPSGSTGKDACDGFLKL